MSISSLMKNCEGCASKCDINLRVFNNKENRICPCTNCLIKMVCEDSCKEYYLFHQYAYEQMKKQKRFNITSMYYKRANKKG